MATRSKAITLTSKRGRRNNSPYQSVSFFISPEMSEARSVNYAEIADIRMPASILIWMGTSSRNFSINGKFLARSTTEADLAFRNLNVLKSWCVAAVPGVRKDKPFVRNGGIGGKDSPIVGAKNPDDNKPKSPGDIDGANKEDEPLSLQTFSQNQEFSSLFQDGPEVLMLEGYSGQFKSIPVVITSLTINYPSDTDYVPNSNGVLVPILHEVNIALKEAREINDLTNGFSLGAFKRGLLETW